MLQGRSMSGRVGVAVRHLPVLAPDLLDRRHVEATDPLCVPHLVRDEPRATVLVAMNVWTPEPVALPPIDRQPLVSVLITSHNYERFIAEAVESALTQTYRYVEVIVADDASEDDSCAVIEGLAARDGRVTLLRSQVNRGMAATTNAAYRASKGSIICLLDADDVFLPDKIERVVDLFTTEPNAGFLLHALTVVDADGRAIQRIPLAARFERGWIAERAVRRGGRMRDMPTSALCFRREAAGLVFPIPEDAFRRSADGFVFTLMALVTEVTAIDEPLTLYRVHKRNDFGGMTRSRRSLEAEMGFIRTQIEHVNLYLAERMGTARTIRVERNLKHALCDVVLALIDGRGLRRLRHEHRDLPRMLLTDDLYGPIHKAWWGALLLVSLIVPRRWRERYFGSALGYRRSKQALFDLVTRWLPGRPPTRRPPPNPGPEGT